MSRVSTCFLLFFGAMENLGVVGCSGESSNADWRGLMAEIEVVQDKHRVEGTPTPPRRVSIHQLVDAELDKSIGPLLSKKPSLINSKNKDGYTPLHTACLKGTFACAKTLLEIGENQSPKIDINARDSTGWTPIHCASLNGHVHCVQLLIEHGADIRAITSNGSTALHYAASWGRLECMRVLVEAGCNVNQRSTYSGQTPLHVATSKGYTQCVNYLLEQGANVMEVDTIGRSCHDIAMHESHDDIAGILTEYKKRVPWFKKWKAFLCCHHSGDLYSVLPSASDRINDEMEDPSSV